MNLQRRSDNNKLLRFASGKLMRECCCENSCVVACNYCDPCLKRYYRLTLSGLGGNFAGFNGEHVLVYGDISASPCFWIVPPLVDPAPYSAIQMRWTNDHWFLDVTDTDCDKVCEGPEECACFIRYIGPSDPCDPTSAYGVYEVATQADCCEDDPTTGSVVVSEF